MSCLHISSKTTVKRVLFQCFVPQQFKINNYKNERLKMIMNINEFLFEYIYKALKSPSNWSSQSYVCLISTFI